MHTVELFLEIIFKFQSGFLENEQVETDCEIIPWQKVARNHAELLTIERGFHKRMSLFFKKTIFGY